MAVGIGVGALTGWLMASRWAMLAAPAAFAVVFEILRIGLDGPTIDAPAVSQFGLFAVIVGRGFHGLVGLVPMIFGSALGAGAARHTPSSGSQGPGTIVRRTTAAFVALALAALAIAIARPATTDPILAADGTPLAGSIAELTSVEVEGIDHALMIRGHDTSDPVLLFLAGGPGGAERGAMRRHLAELEEHFVVVTWDQRGTGASYAQLDPTETVTLDGYVRDTVAITEHLLDRFDRDDLYLLGQSWGTTLGVLAVQQRPELYAAYIGTGQMVSQRETDQIFYRDTVVSAMSSGDTDLLTHLISIGEPPYDEMLSYEVVLSNPDLYPYDHSPNSEGAGAWSENFIVPEYTLVDQIHMLGAFMDTFAAMYPQLQDVDFRETATEFETPMFFIQGRYEAPGRSSLFDEWYSMLDAPIKEVHILDTSGHRPLFEQPERFVEVMTNAVLAEAEGGQP
jgi:pimeloyl-ACP methyl ester carboxylesterase